MAREMGQANIAFEGVQGSSQILLDMYNVSEISENLCVTLRKSGGLK